MRTYPILPFVVVNPPVNGLSYTPEQAEMIGQLVASISHHILSNRQQMQQAQKQLEQVTSDVRQIKRDTEQNRDDLQRIKEASVQLTEEMQVRFREEAKANEELQQMRAAVLDSNATAIDALRTAAALASENLEETRRTTEIKKQTTAHLKEFCEANDENNRQLNALVKATEEGAALTQELTTTYLRLATAQESLANERAERQADEKRLIEEMALTTAAQDRLNEERALTTAVIRQQGEILQKHTDNQARHLDKWDRQLKEMREQVTELNASVDERSRFRSDRPGESETQYRARLAEQSKAEEAEERRIQQLIRDTDEVIKRTTLRLEDLANKAAAPQPVEPQSVQLGRRIEALDDAKDEFNLDNFFHTLYAKVVAFFGRIVS